MEITTKVIMEQCGHKTTTQMYCIAVSAVGIQGHVTVLKNAKGMIYTLYKRENN